MTTNDETFWIWDGQEFTEEDIGKSEGFVYLITNLITGRQYVGRKYFTSKRKLKKSDKRRSTRASDWVDYFGSSPELLADIELCGKSNFRREILSLHKTRGDTNIAEVKEQFARNVLEDPNYYNANINGRWHKAPDHIINARRFKRLDNPTKPE